MAETDELVRRIAQAKAFIDNGLCRVGPGLDREGRIEALMTGGASRALALADAVVQLCRQSHPNEALPLLRQLGEIAAGLRWAAAADGEARARELLAEAGSARWQDLWDGERLRRRAREGGMPAADVEDVLGLAADFVRGNSAVAPWSHLFEQNRRPGVDTARALGLAARLMGHVLKALDARWPGSFPGAEAMWE